MSTIGSVLVLTHGGGEIGRGKKKAMKEKRLLCRPFVSFYVVAASRGGNSDKKNRLLDQKERGEEI